MTVTKSISCTRLLSHQLSHSPNNCSIPLATVSLSLQTPPLMFTDQLSVHEQLFHLPNDFSLPLFLQFL